MPHSDYKATVSILVLCCNEIIEQYVCVKCGARQYCYYCSFDYDEPHGCDE